MGGGNARDREGIQGAGTLRGGCEALEEDFDVGEPVLLWRVGGADGDADGGFEHAGLVERDEPDRGVHDVDCDLRRDGLWSVTTRATVVTTRRRARTGKSLVDSTAESLRAVCGDDAPIGWIGCSRRRGT